MSSRPRLNSWEVLTLSFQMLCVLPTLYAVYFVKYTDMWIMQGWTKMTKFSDLDAMDDADWDKVTSQSMLVASLC